MQESGVILDVGRTHQAVFDAALDIWGCLGWLGAPQPRALDVAGCLVDAWGLPYWIDDASRYEPNLSTFYVFQTLQGSADTSFSIASCAENFLP